MKRLGCILVLALSSAVGCGRPFVPATPTSFVELDSKYTEYEYRATTADGLVIGIQVVKHKPRGELAFWERAVENQLRMRGGYALLDKRDVQNRNGIRGRQLRFGHDEAGKPHLYYVTIYPTKRRLFIVEAGGTKEQMETNAALIEQAVTQLYVRRCWKFGC